MYWLEIAMPDGELMVWEHLDAKQVLFMRNNYIILGHKTRTGKHKNG